MPTNLETRPWFVDTLVALIRGIYFSNYQMRAHDMAYWRGFVSCAVAIAFGVGGDPRSFLTNDDVQLMGAITNGK